VERVSCPMCEGVKLSCLKNFERVPLVQCVDCFGVSTRDLASEEILVAYYESIYTRKRGYSSPISVKRREEVLETFEEFRKLNRVLDIGCGQAHFLDQALGRDWETFGTEFTEDAVILARDYGHTMHQGPLLDAQYPSNFFDIVIYTEVIEHIDTHALELPEILRILRPGGIIYVTTPNFDSASRRLLGDRWSVIHFPEHLTYFTRETLIETMERYGFETEWTTTHGVSFSRMKQGVGVKKTVEEGGLYSESARTTDEGVRSLLEANTALGVGKLIVNELLDVSGFGDSLKGVFRKPGNAG